MRCNIFEKEFQACLNIKKTTCVTGLFWWLRRFSTKNLCAPYECNAMSRAFFAEIFFPTCDNIYPMFLLTLVAFLQYTHSIWKIDDIVSFFMDIQCFIHSKFLNDLMYNNIYGIKKCVQRQKSWNDNPFFSIISAVWTIS